MQTLQLTPHFTFREAIYSDTALHSAYFNYPATEEEFQNILATANKMEVVRSILGQPIQVTSWLRNLDVNRRIGSLDTSDHIHGNAVDFRCPNFGTPVQVCKSLLTHLDEVPFKQLILEGSWVHISFNHSIPDSSAKHEVLTLLKGGNYAKELTNLYGEGI